MSMLGIALIAGLVFDQLEQRLTQTKLVPILAASLAVSLADLPQFCLSRKFFEHNRMHGNAASSFVCG
jgi:hypothetical protein